MGFDEKFNRILNKHPEWSSLVCFKTALMYCPIKNKATIKRKFFELVDPDDYDPKDRKLVKELLDDLYNTNPGKIEFL